MMEQLSKGGTYRITEKMRSQLADFYGNFATEEETAGAIKALYGKQAM